MRPMDGERRIDERKRSLEQRLSRRFEQVTIRGKHCFRTAEGAFFSLTAFPGNEAIVIEYAENPESAELNRFEDGDLFYLDEMNEAEMLQSMLREIGQ